jgi:pyridoxine kinase
VKSVISIQSHVVFGHAGNSSAVFPMRRMGVDVWPINTVQYSNHTQYAEGWTGKAIPADEITELMQGLDNIQKLPQCAGLISGYQGSAAQCDAVAQAVQRLKQRNSQALYVCDPVMGDPEKGCIVADGIKEKFLEQLLPMADVIVPNQYELTQLTGVEIHTLDDAIKACHVALEKGPKIVLVKHLHSLSQSQFCMMLATEKVVFLAKRPHIPFAKAPVGVGDLITGVFTASLIKGMVIGKAFKHVNNAVYGVLKETQEQQAWELETIAAQQEFVDPSHDFEIIKVG